MENGLDQIGHFFLFSYGWDHLKSDLQKFWISNVSGFQMVGISDLHCISWVDCTLPVNCPEFIISMIVAFDHRILI